jgi:hypothetical protein
MAAWIIGGLGVATGIIGGITGSQQAASQNAQAEQIYRDQKKAAERTAARTNEYNKKVFAADQENYKNTRAYEWETAVKNWQYNQEVRDFDYLQQVKQYAGSVENTYQQLTYNSVAAMRAQESEQASLNEIMNQMAFQSESNLIDSLQQEGQVALMQAGKSRSKAIQTTVGELGRNAAIMRASLTSAGQQSVRNLQDIAMSKRADDMKAMAAMMIRPERLPDIPEPTQAPERIFVEPMEVTADYIAPPIRQSTFAPIISGLSSAIGSAQSAWAIDKMS